MPLDKFEGAGDFFGVIPPEPEKVPDRSSEQCALETVVGLLKQDLLSLDEQELLVTSMTPTAQREIVSRIAGLDASVLMTVKKQIHLVDTVLRRMVSEDGTALATAEDYDIPLKDAFNLSLKVTQMIVRDLPKIYGIERIQKQEEALRRVMEKHLSREQQDALLEELERIEDGGVA